MSVKMSAHYAFIKVTIRFYRMFYIYDDSLPKFIPLDIPDKIIQGIERIYE